MAHADEASQTRTMRSGSDYLGSLEDGRSIYVDGELVRDVVGNMRSQETITAIVQLAQSMNLRTTAESVESDGILEAVAQLGLDYGQGFAIGRPIPLADVLTELPLPSDATAERRAARDDGDTWYAAGSR